MSLYLCIFDEEREVVGVDVGSYDDFDALRTAVAQALEADSWGSRFPFLQLHSDCDGEWDVNSCYDLRSELILIKESLQQLPAVPYASEWQVELAAGLGLVPNTLANSFIDVNGKLLLDQILCMCDWAIREELPILFQ